MTVEADQVRVESRLAARGIDCPDCSGSLRPWGWARPRGVHGLAGVLRPRRARCSSCLATHVLLPVTMLGRRAYAVEVIGSALTAHADGRGHRGIGTRLAVPESTVRGWLRVMGSRLEATRLHLLQVARRAGTPRHRADQGPARNQRTGPSRTQIVGNTDDANIGKMNDVQQTSVCASARRRANSDKNRA